ncbi:M48 family metallopeptidase [Phormidium yuhuli AB48]|uniref:M48 family metallopeptidase n=1 Tax=Phormidium yuhuli AB48 TaxID=2940671 RepID=A0ABY5AQX6_9CYAN|nr:M48 family metallopeptidase [Phormidium yuhuli]USR91176.1 M48 family metallopeptidase [Phormidium yuhuli AB48]
MSRLPRRLLYGTLSLVTAVSVLVVSTPVGYGFSLFDILPNVIQVIQISSMSDRQEVALGRQINDRLVRDVRISNNRQVNNYVNAIGQRLVAVSSRANLPFTFQVVEDDNINAFATLGGFVYVNTGLIRRADNEAELAGVVAHEIAHVTERHVLARLRQAAIAEGVMNAAGINPDVLVNIAYELVINRPNSRSAEYEADEVGMQLLIAGNYAPVGMINFFERLLSGGGGLPQFLNTHPDTRNRVARLREILDPSRAAVGDGLDSNHYRQQIQSLI